ncbi:MAG: hypothetical protein HY735_03405 [Verrucomicrobia bacterium]|nr:hypothetical protein [Verrucomicrobiota bacterium]
MNTLTAPKPTSKIEPGFSPKPAKRRAPRGEESESPSPSSSPHDDTPSPSGALRRQFQSVAKARTENANGHPARIKNGIVSFS